MLILQTYEEHMAKTGAASQEMAQRINALIQENSNKTVRISSLMRERPGNKRGSFGNMNLDCKSRPKRLKLWRINNNSTHLNDKAPREQVRRVRGQ